MNTWMINANTIWDVAKIATRAAFSCFNANVKHDWAINEFGPHKKTAHNSFWIINLNEKVSVENQLHQIFESMSIPVKISNGTQDQKNN